MNLINLIKHLIFAVGFVVLTFAAGCSSRILSENHRNLSPTPLATPESCKMFAGEWVSYTFKDIDDESKMVCDGKPCAKAYEGSVDMRINCTEGKITGEKVLAWSTYGIVSNIAVPNKTPFVPEEMIAPLNEGRVEDGVLYLFLHF